MNASSHLCCRFFMRCFELNSFSIIKYQNQRRAKLETSGFLLSFKKDPVTSPLFFTLTVLLFFAMRLLVMSCWCSCYGNKQCFCCWLRCIWDIADLSWKTYWNPRTCSVSVNAEKMHTWQWFLIPELTWKTLVDATHLFVIILEKKYLPDNDSWFQNLPEIPDLNHSPLSEIAGEVLTWLNDSWFQSLPERPGGNHSPLSEIAGEVHQEQQPPGRSGKTAQTKKESEER